MATEKKKTSVTINGKTYKLRFDVMALEGVEEAFGGIREAFSAMTGKGMVDSIRKMFRITANCQRNLEGKPEDVTGEEITPHMSMGTLTAIADAIRAAVETSMESETNGGEADDEGVDALADEYDAKNG